MHWRAQGPLLRDPAGTEKAPGKPTKAAGREYGLSVEALPLS